MIKLRFFSKSEMKAIRRFPFSVVIIVYFIRRALLSSLSLLSVIYPWGEAQSPFVKDPQISGS